MCILCRCNLAQTSGIHVGSLVLTKGARGDLGPDRCVGLGGCALPHLYDGQGACGESGPGRKSQRGRNSRHDSAGAYCARGQNDRQDSDLFDLRGQNYRQDSDLFGRRDVRLPL